MNRGWLNRRYYTKKFYYDLKFEHTFRMYYKHFFITSVQDLMFRT